MFKFLALASVLTSAVLAQTPATNNPLIPSGISQPCTTFLNALNTDSTFASCLSTLTNITSAFAPGAPTPSDSDVSSTLTNLCANSVTSACPDSLIRAQITSFYAACPNELTTGAVKEIRDIYDVLYILSPMQKSICSKDDSGDFCVKGPVAATRDFDEDESLSISKILALLYIKTDNGALTRRDEAIVPNFAAIAQDNSLFLYFTPSQANLCDKCLRDLLVTYIQFQSNIPFAYGTSNSLLLKALSALYSAVQSQCPANFLNGAVQAAGGLSGSSSSAIPTYSAEHQRVIALVMGLVTLVISAAL